MSSRRTRALDELLAAVTGLQRSMASGSSANFNTQPVKTRWFEVAVGDGAMNLTEEKIVAAFTMLLAPDLVVVDKID